MTIFIKCSALVKLYIDTPAKQALEWQCLLSSSLTLFSRRIKYHLSGDRIKDIGQKGDIKQAVCSLDPIHNLKRSWMHLVKNN